MYRFAIAAASLIAATALLGGCEQEPTSQPEPEYSTLLLALCESGDATPERIQEFLDLRADVNAKNEYGSTPLYFAARNKNPEVVTILIEAGAEVNARDNIGSTPLYWAACSNENPEVVTTLIKAGADVNAKNEDGETPLDRAEGYVKTKNAAEVLRAAGGRRGENL